MKTREEVARFIEHQFGPIHDCKLEKGGHGYGKQDLRELMDFIYDSEPKSEAEEISSLRISSMKQVLAVGYIREPSRTAFLEFLGDRVINKRAGPHAYFDDWEQWKSEHPEFAGSY